MEKRVITGYIVVFLIMLTASVFLYFVADSFTGFAIYESQNQSDFDQGTHSNTEWNGSSVALAADNVSGTYTSQVFDATADATWNNISWESGTPTVNIETLYIADNNADIWDSSDGITWNLIKDDYNAAEGNNVDYLVKNSSGSLFIMNNQDLWASDDSGLNWTKVNDDFNPSDSNGGFVIKVDSNNNIYIIDGSQDLWKSTDSGVSFTKINDDYNGGDSNNALGMAINNSDDLIVVDASADIWVSVDEGLNWTLVNDDYNGGNSNSATDMFINSSDALFILHNQDLWQSLDAGVTWTLANDDFNGGSDSNSGQVMYIDSNDNIYIADGSEDVYKSTDSGTNFSLIASDMNGGNGNIKGISSLVAASTTTLDFNVRSCNDDACSGESWTDITDTSPQDLSLTDNQYFQYKIDFTSPSAGTSSFVDSVTIDYTLLNQAPTITLVNPTEGATFGTNTSLALDYIVADADDNLNTCWYHIDSGANQTLTCGLNTTFNIADGSHIIYVYVNDTNNEIASDSNSFTVSVGSPGITLHSPVDSYLATGQDIEFSYTPSDTDLEDCALWGNFTGTYTINQTDSSPTNDAINYFYINHSADGNYLWNVQCNDTAGHSAINGNQTFTIDTVNPDIVITEPTGSKSSRTITANWEANDTNLNSCLYNVYRGLNIEVVNTTINCSAGTTNFDVTVDADFTFNFYVNDSAGNQNSSSTSFSVSTGGGGGSGGGGGGGGGGSSSSSTTEENIEISFEELSEIIADPSETKSLSINIKNTGTVFLNNCKLVGRGAIYSWFDSSAGGNLAPGESSDFVFTINIPSDINPGDYSGTLSLECDEGSESKNIGINIPDKSLRLEILDIQTETNKVTILYTLEELAGDSQSISLEFLVIGEDNKELAGNKQTISLSSGEIKESTVAINLPTGSSGDVTILINAESGVSSETIQQNVILGTTGFAIFSLENRTRLSLGILAVLFVGLAVLILSGVVKSYKQKKQSKGVVKADLR